MDSRHTTGALRVERPQQVERFRAAHFTDDDAMPRRANAPKEVVELVAQPQQGRHGQVVSPMQAQVLHHFWEPDPMRVARGHGSPS